MEIIILCVIAIIAFFVTIYTMKKSQEELDVKKDFEDIASGRINIVEPKCNGDYHIYGKHPFGDDLYLYKSKYYVPSTNEFKSAIVHPDYDFSLLKPITKQEYEIHAKTFKNELCNCPVGEGSNIQGDYIYNPIDLFIELLSDKDFEKFDLEHEIFWGHSGISQKRKYHFVMTYKNDKNWFKTEIATKDYHKKACLNCKKCLDEKQELIDILMDAKNKLLKMEADQREVLLICGE